MGNVTKSQQNNITSPNGNSLAVFVEGTTGVMKVKDVLGNIQPLSDFIAGSGLSPFEYNANATGIQPILGTNNASGCYSSIGGGNNNIAQQLCSGYGTASIGGGSNNSIYADYGGVISGGFMNQITGGGLGFIGGGGKNQIISSGYYNNIVGGRYNSITSGCYNSIGGGSCNTASGEKSTIGGGRSNTASGNYSIIGGGKNNISSNCCSTIGGGFCNSASGISSIIGGGICNIASGFISTISGGQSNTGLGTWSAISGGCSNSASNTYASIGGGKSNNASGFGSTIGGGFQNTASCFYSTIGGGYINIASGQRSIIGGGTQNTASGSCSAILGGQCNNTCGFANAMIIGSNLCATQSCTTFTNCLSANNLTVGCAVSVGANKVLINSPFTNGGGLFAQTSNSTPITATTVEGTLIDGGVGTLTVPANGFNIGDSFNANLSGIMSAQNNNTITIRVKSGSVILAQSNALVLPSITNQVWSLTLDFTIRTLGGTGVASIVTLGQMHILKLASGTQEGFGFNSINSTTFDTTISNTLSITAQWSSNNANNSIYSDLFVLTKIF